MRRVQAAGEADAAVREVQGCLRRLRLDRLHEPIANVQLSRFLPGDQARHGARHPRHQLALLRRDDQRQGQAFAAAGHRGGGRRHGDRRAAQAARLRLRLLRRAGDCDVPDLPGDQAEGVRPLRHAAAGGHRAVAVDAGAPRGGRCGERVLGRAPLRDHARLLRGGGGASARVHPRPRAGHVLRRAPGQLHLVRPHRQDGAHHLPGGGPCQDLPCARGRLRALPRQEHRRPAVLQQHRRRLHRLLGLCPLRQHQVRVAAQPRGLHRLLVPRRRRPGARPGQVRHRGGGRAHRRQVSHTQGRLRDRELAAARVYRL
mmetsp:Transcript_21836/g.55583  ORF Transcript_21836/g.55583 Transcript_21836/m.55583 type:complete len:315 (+) Transcript_21836:243-1187(+)